MTDLADLADIAPIQVFDGIRARRVLGGVKTLAVVELDPGAVVPEHRHAHEQNGMVITGQMTFRVGRRSACSGRAGRGASSEACRTPPRQGLRVPW